LKQSEILGVMQFAIGSEKKTIEAIAAGNAVLGDALRLIKTRRELGTAPFADWQSGRLHVPPLIRRDYDYLITERVRTRASFLGEMMNGAARQLLTHYKVVGTLVSLRWWET
jgi:hypothetical protein